VKGIPSSCFGKKIGDGPAAVIGDEICNKPLSFVLSNDEDGKAQKVGRSESQKTCLDILHKEVFEAKTVKGVCG
jgi:hypothetical protein